MERQEFQRNRSRRAFSSDRGAARRAHALLRTALTTHFVGPDDQLVEQFISSALSTSRNAVRQALQMLVRDGVVVRHPRSGTRIVRQMVRANVDGYKFLGLSTDEAQRRVSIELIERGEVPATALVTRMLDLTGDTMLMVEHLVKLDGEPICIDSGYHEANVPAERFEIGFDQNTVFENYYGTGAGESECSFQAIVADPATAKLLGVPDGAPLLLQEVVLTDDQGRPRELRYTHYRADRVCIVTTTQRLAVSARDSFAAQESG
jgi:GntR family transcriptional regulator